MMEFEELAKRIAAAREECLISPRTGMSSPTGDWDVSRMDIAGDGPDGRTMFVEVDVDSPTFVNEVCNFLDANEGALRVNLIHVIPEDEIREVGLSDRRVGARGSRDGVSGDNLASPGRSFAPIGVRGSSRPSVRSLDDGMGLGL